MEKLVARFGDILCRVTHNLDVKAAVRMTLSDFAAYAAAQHDDSPLYIFDPHFGASMPSLLSDYVIPNVFNEDLLAVLPLEMRPDFRWLVVGPARSGASWHVDPAKTSAWNALLVGRKRWALYPPGRCPPGVTLLDEDTASPATSSLDWFLHVYPTLSDADRPFEVVQEPGDVISVPSGWWHVVLNLEFTIAVTQNVVDSHNVTCFAHDLIADGNVERLTHIRSLVAPTHPSLGHLLSLHTMPVDEGYLNEPAMVQHAFSETTTWQPRIRSVFADTPNLVNAIEAHLTRHPWTRPIQALTSRVNPTFSVHDLFVVKWFSPLNRLWGECHEAHVLTLDFPKLQSSSTPGQGPQDSPNPSALSRLLEAAFDMEQLVYTLMREIATSLAPSMVASGYLPDRPKNAIWKWPYVVTTYDPAATSLAHAVKTHGGLLRSSWFGLVEWLGQDWFPMFHGLQVPSRPGVLGTDIASIQWYIQYLQRLRDGCFAVHASNQVIPARLLCQLDSYLPRNAATLVTAATPVVLLHQDLTDENILGHVRNASSPLVAALSTLPPLDRTALEAYCSTHGIQSVDDLIDVEPWEDETGTSDATRWKLFKQFHVESALATSFVLAPDPNQDSEDGDDDRVNLDGDVQWTPCLVIDFADTKTGDPLWDLIPVVFSMLHGDISLCRALLQSPYWTSVIATHSNKSSLCHVLMHLTLLHPSQSIPALFHHFPGARTLATWEDVALHVFGPMVDGLSSNCAPLNNFHDEAVATKRTVSAAP
ncbi:hypothetical protein, variant [Aphanomyces invadans]|nr:hypothetical protein, variant [Aphanomyces invadans]ETW04696.1 hypothetical protein, variant [Aphanomyces invadans]|eukprot:XP_008866133.1 hypothetical protein, variant [Aphanomyces invadans]